MRNLQTHDVFVGVRVINSIGIKEEVAKIYTQMQKTKKFNVEDIGMEFVLNIMAKCGDSQTERTIYEFLSGPLEIPVDEIATMDPIELFGNIKQLGEFIDKEAWQSFFKSVAALIQK